MLLLYARAILSHILTTLKRTLNPPQPYSLHLTRDQDIKGHKAIKSNPNDKKR
jgi:hypothetical protein